jgi:hypothetical protein
LSGLVKLRSGPKAGDHVPRRLKGIILDEAYRTTTINEGEKRINIPIAQAVVRTMAVNAARGQHRAQKLFAELLSTTEAANNTPYREYFGAALDYRNIGKARLRVPRRSDWRYRIPFHTPRTSASIMATGTISYTVSVPPQKPGPELAEGGDKP